MGKSLRGKECGKGICQRKDGLYSARFVTKTGKHQASASPHFRKHEIGWTMPSMQISTKIYLFRQI